MPIQLRVKTVTDYDVHSILHYYNTHKPSQDPVLEELSSRSGFFVRVVGSSRRFQQMDPVFHETVRQVRWKNNTFATYFNHHALTEIEDRLFYEALTYTFGEEKVVYYPSICSVLKYSSPNTISSFMQ